jgi:hypothetical protein
VRNQLEWSVLDVEEDEWNRHITALDGAAANGFSLVARPGQTAAAVNGTDMSCRSPRPWFTSGWSWRSLVLGSSAVLIFAVAIAYGAWRTAQEGLAHLELDVANVVTLENVTAHAVLPTEHGTATVESIELLGSMAMAQVVMTKTSALGNVTEVRQPRFYIHTATGWERTGPLAAFWGPTASLDTSNLHLVFGSRDRAAVEQIAPTAELLYSGFTLATGQTLTAGGPLTIEIVPRYQLAGAAFVEGRILVTSPFLFSSGIAMSKEETFARLLHYAICEPILAALWQMPVKPQWQPLLHDGFHCRQLNDIITAGTPAAAIFNWSTTVNPRDYMRLNSLLDRTDVPGSAPAQQTANERERGGVNMYLAGTADSQTQARAVGATQLVAFIAATYGLDSLPRMVQGFRTYDDWESLAPAVFGVSAAELEAAWHTGLP